MKGTDCGDVAAEWLTAVLGRKCRLVRQHPCHHRSRRTHSHTQEEVPVRLSLANEAQYLLLARSSLEQLIGEIKERNDEEASSWVALDSGHLAARFRPNFIVEARNMEPYAEESWKEIRIGNHLFQVLFFKKFCCC